MQTINTFSVETPKGIRNFHIHKGDICDSNDELIVASSHANPDFPPSGQVIRALQLRHGYDFSTLEPLLVRRGHFGTFLAEAVVSRPTVLLVRIPGASSIEEEGGAPLEVFEEALWTLFGSLAALEFKGRLFKSVSLPILAGRRDYPIHEILVLFLRNAVKWLRMSQATQAISLYVQEDQDFSQWYEEMDRILGRKYFDTAKDTLLDGLRQEVLGLLKRASTRHDAFPLMDRWMDDLVTGLGENVLRFHTLAVAGRKLAEFVVDYLSAQFGIAANGYLYTNIKTIRETGKVAPWVINYLLSLKDFGNEDAHIGNDISYRPKTVSQDDLLALLCSVHRLVQIWLEWESDGIIS